MHWLLVLALATACPEYRAAYKKADANDTLLVVMLSADWCEACQRMKKNEIPKVQDLIDKVGYAYIDVDEHEKLARELAGEGGGLPQVIAFWKVKGGWVRGRLTGFQNAKQLREAFESWVAKTKEK